MKKINILYIGNNLSTKNNYVTTLEFLTQKLRKENYNVKVTSDKKNKVIRMLDMCISIYKNRNTTDYILIDTYSTLNFYYAFLTSQIARFFNIKYIPILHGGNLPDRINKSKILSNLIFKNSYKNVAPSKYLKEVFESKNYKVIYIPNTIDISKYEFKKRSSTNPNLLWVRSFKEIYNPILGLKVFKKLINNYPYAKLCMVGPHVDESYRKCKEYVKDNNLSESVIFTGPLSKENWIEKSKNYDIFINTTNYDNTPISVIEAMALGLTVISTNVGGMPYLIANNKDGLLVNKNNVEEMHDAILNILKYKNSFAENARIKVEKFSWEVVKNKWIDILN